ERLIRIRSEIQVVRLKAGADQGELARGGIEHGKMSIRFLNRKRLRGRMVRALFAEIRILACTDTRGEPDPSFFIHHRVVIERLAVPDRLGAPIRRWTERIVLRRRRVRRSEE